MTALFTVLIIIVSILLILIVLVQNAKGGGLASNFASSNQFMGVRKTADFLEKATWSLAVALLFFCLMSSFSYSEKEKAPKSQMENINTNTPPAGVVPGFGGNQQQNQPAPSTGTQATPGAQNNQNTQGNQNTQNKPASDKEKK